MLLDLQTLAELYPDRAGRCQFLRRAVEILRDDRRDLRRALAGRACARAGDLAHRIQGSVAFLTGQPEQAASLLQPLARAIKQGLPPGSQQVQDIAQAHLLALESTIEKTIGELEP
ncbi:hypothetical protein CAL12_09730 [Bordetella genomosp. 8]|uniref:HPt domain-containing protein n=1 Tax=Bordetella genomosp. 8 TaxID=1416806 RepID=A0A1W6YJ26_9BORD|nr:hypothetical protein [Bordetella genomosp. 8]ARP81095.1 hypothetical protein CAL12_09730 [Bordetella genomosp. 8]